MQSEQPAPQTIDEYIAGFPPAVQAILGRIRAAGIPFRSRVHGPADGRVDTDHGAASSTGTTRTVISGRC